eukprot:5406933-Prorocentrum_lima.AAC.1
MSSNTFLPAVEVVPCPLPVPPDVFHPCAQSVHFCNSSQGLQEQGNNWIWIAFDLEANHVMTASYPQVVPLPPCSLLPERRLHAGCPIVVPLQD